MNMTFRNSLGRRNPLGFTGTYFGEYPVGLVSRGRPHTGAPPAQELRRGRLRKGGIPQRGGPSSSSLHYRPPPRHRALPLWNPPFPKPPCIQSFFHHIYFYTHV
jgi:hypothetical protein